MVLLESCTVFQESCTVLKESCMAASTIWLQYHYDYKCTWVKHYYNVHNIMYVYDVIHSVCVSKEVEANYISANSF